MPLPASPIDICNLALDQLGEAPITSITPPVTDTENILARHYDSVRREALRKGVWPFAKQGANVSSIGSSAVAPITGSPPQPLGPNGAVYDYTDAYALPKDFVRLLSVNGVDEWCQTFCYDLRSDLNGAGQVLCMNNAGATTANIRYISDVITVTQWDDLFRRVMVLELALSVAYQITKDKDVVQRIAALLDPVRKEAAAIAGQERRPVRIERSKVLRDRRSGAIGLGSGADGWCDFAIPPTPSNPPSGTVTSVSVFSNVTPLVFAGGPITVAGTITLNAQGAIGSLPIFSNLNTLTNLAPGSSGQVLTIVSGKPAWTTVGGTGTVTSVGLTVNGASTVLSVSGSPVTTAGALTLSVSTALGDLIYASSANNIGRLAIGSNGNVLTIVSGLPAWGSAGGGSVTSVGVALSGLTSFITISGSPVTSSGSITLTASVTTGDMLYASATNTVSRLAIGGANNVLTSISGIPTWSPPATNGTVTSVGISVTGFATLGVSGSPVTTSGTLALTVTATAGDLLYASATNTISRLGIGGNGNVLTVVSGLPAWVAGGGSGTVTSVGLSMPGEFSVASSPVTTSGTLTVTWANENALAVMSGPNTPNAAAATPSFKGIDRCSITPGISGLRALPTTGAISGIYYNNGNWTQTGTITSTEARIYNNGTMTINGSWVVATEGLGGAGGNVITTGTTSSGGKGAGLGGGEGGASNGITLLGGGGGGHGSFGGTGGASVASSYITQGGPTYTASSVLMGSGGGGGTGAAGGAGGSGGAAGGSLVIQASGNITFTAAANMTATGGTGQNTGVTGTASGGGGSGGGIFISTNGTITLTAGGAMSATGGAGGTAPTSGVAGGGGSGGIIVLYGSTITSGFTPSAVGGLAGSGGTQAANAGGTGTLSSNGFVIGPRVPG